MRGRSPWTIGDLVIAIAGAAVVLVIAKAVAPEDGSGECLVIEVIDGDTVRCADWDVTLRYADVDTPELRGFQCEKELYLAMYAADINSKLIREQGAGVLQLTNLCFNCDRYGRAIATVHAGNIDVAEHLIQLGLGVPYGLGKPDWCAEGGPHGGAVDYPGDSVG